MTWVVICQKLDKIDCCIVDPDSDTDSDSDPESWVFLGVTHASHLGFPSVIPVQAGIQARADLAVPTRK